MRTNRGMGKKFNIVLIVLFILTIIAFAFAEGGQNQLDQEITSQWTLIGKVGECRGLLNNSSRLEFIKQRGKLIRKQISLCILNMETGHVFEKRYWLDQKDINRANVLRSNYQSNPANLPKFIPLNPNEEFEVINNRWNNWNSDWSINKIGSSSNDIYVVAANKFLVPDSYIVYAEDRTGPEYSDIIYAPYSEALHNIEVIRIGTKYITEKVVLAFEDLRKLGVQSRAFPGQPIVETVTEKFVKEILINEQTDPDMILNKARTDGEKRKVAERVLVRYGLNGDKTFRYTVSKTGASGMAQIMATTYTYPRTKDGMLEKYPQANLIKDVKLGRLDPLNAIKTEILVFDDKMMQVKEKVAKSGSREKNIFNNLTPDQLDEVRAMGYNGGASKYNPPTGTLKTRAKGRKAKLGLIETRGFIEKLRVIRYLKLFD